MTLRYILNICTRISSWWGDLIAPIQPGLDKITLIETGWMAILKYKKSIIIAICIFFLLIVFVNLIDKFFDKFDLTFQTPIKTQSPVLINPRVEFVSPIDEAWALEGTGEGAASPSLREPITDIEKEIYMVFGEEHFDKAMMIVDCENKEQDPKAVNVNTDTHNSRDIGIFQINQYWQKVGNAKFLFDPAINIRIAWRIYENDGYSFKQWTCGKKYKI